MSSEPIRVVIADGHPLFRDGLARSLRRDPHLQLLAELHEADDALATIRELRPDVAVIDASLDGRSVLDAVAREQLPTRVVLLAGTVRPDTTFDAIAAGARGYLSKHADGAALSDAIHRVAAGGGVLCPELQAALSGEIRTRRRERLLTPREQETLVLMARGLTTPEIARRLHLAPSTVKGYITSVYERLGVANRAQAVVAAMRRGLLD